MGGVLDSGSIYFTLPATRSHNTYVISFEVCWENAVGGRSVVVVKNVDGDQADATFLQVFEMFKYMLERRLRDDFVDLTV